MHLQSALSLTTCAYPFAFSLQDIEFMLRDPYTFIKGPDMYAFLGDFLGHVRLR